MLIVETIGRIRREYFRKGKPIKEIARYLHVSRDTVCKVVRSGATEFTYDRELQPRPRLERSTGEFETLLARNAEQAVYTVECRRPCCRCPLGSCGGPSCQRLGHALSNDCRDQ